MTLTQVTEAPNGLERRATKSLAIVDLVLLVTVACFLHHILHRTDPDIIAFYLPWYEHVLQHGRWASLEGSFVTYTPPYVYVLSASTLLNGFFDPVVILKLMELPAIIAAGVFAWRISLILGSSAGRAVLAGCLVVLAPEVIGNALLWGQCDMLQTAVLFAMLWSLLARRWSWAMLAFGVALAVKLQAILVGPAIAALLLAGEVPLLSALWIPVAYAAMMVPAWLAGRSALALLTIYRSQTSLYPEIGRNVANPYQLLLHWARFSREPVIDRVDTAGILVALVVSVAMIAVLTRHRHLLRGRNLIAAVALPLLVEPYVLPKMHDRYYFAGNTFLLLLAALDGRFAVAALLTQAAAIAVYYRFLSNGQFNPGFYVMPTLLVTVALGLFLRQYLCRFGWRTAGSLRE